MVLAPPPERERASVAIVRGPNIGAPLSLEPLPDRLAGTVGIKLGDKVTTDDIMPAGSRLKYRSNIPRYAEFVFELVDPSFSRRCRELAAQGRDVVIVGGHSYGQGSSREHAAICPRFLGVKAVLARSFERIHFANLINFGILPLVFERDSDYEAIGAGESIECTGLRAAIRDADRLAARLGSGQSLTLRLNATARQRAILLAGGILRYAAAGQGAGR